MRSTIKGEAIATITQARRRVLYREVVDRHFSISTSVVQRALTDFIEFVRIRGERCRFVRIPFSIGNKQGQMLKNNTIKAIAVAIHFKIRHNHVISYLLESALEL